MKKSLSLLVAIAMVFSMFATVVSAAPAEGQSAGEYLKELGVIQGDENGNLNETGTLKRQDAVVLLARLVLGLEDAEALAGAEADHDFTDVRGDYYNAVIAWAVEEGLINGQTATSFGFDSEVKAQDLATMLFRALGYTVGTDEDADIAYADVLAAAVEAGLLPEGTENGDLPVRGAIYTVLVTALDTEGADGVKLGTKLGLPGYEDAAFRVVKAEQSNAREITVSFNKAATEEQQADLKYEVKSGTVPFTVAKKYAEDGTSVALTADYLPVGEYEVTVEGFDPVTVTIAEEVATKIEIGAASVQRIENQDLKIELLNQFGKAISNPTLNISVYNASKGVAAAVDADGKYDLTGGDHPTAVPTRPYFDVDDVIVVTATHGALSASKNYKLLAGSAATSIKLGTVLPLEGKTRISAGNEDLVVPVELVDQHGNKFSLPEVAKTALGGTATSFEHGGLIFTLSQAGVISNWGVNDKGNLVIDVATAATFVIHAINPATTATGSTTFKIEGPAVLKTLNLQKPGKLIAAGEEVVVPFTAVDNFGDAMKAKDIEISATFAQDKLTFTSSLAIDPAYPRFNGKGELVFKFADVPAKLSGIITGFVNGQQVASLTLDVNPKAEVKKINGLKDVLTTLVQGVEVEFDKDNVTYLDQYGRTHGVGSLVLADDQAAVDGLPTGTIALIVVSGSSVDVIVEDPGTDETITNLEATTTTGDTKFKIQVAGVANSAYEFTAKVVELKDVKSYELKGLGTVYAKDTHTEASDYAKPVEVVGKIGSTQVALDQATAYDFVTVQSSNNAVGAGENGANYKVFGLDEGTATVAVYKNGVKLAEGTVTASKAAPVATTVEFNKGEYVLAAPVAGPPAVPGGTDTVTVTVKDQYGVALTGPTAVPGYLSIGDTDVATLAGGVVTAVAKGTTTLTYITSNGTIGTAVVVVN